MSRYDESDSVGAAVASAIVLIVILVFALVDCHERDQCVDGGGRVEITGHHTIWIPVSCGKDCTTYVPTEIDEWRCARD